MLHAVIPRNVRVSEAPGYGQSVLTYDPGSRGSTSYVEAARELAQRGVDLPPLDRATGTPRRRRRGSAGAPTTAIRPDAGPPVSTTVSEERR